MDTPQTVARAIGLAMADALKERSITTQAAAEASGIPRTTLIRRLTGTSPLYVDELAALCDLLGVSMADFVGSVTAVVAS